MNNHLLIALLIVSWLPATYANDTPKTLSIISWNVWFDNKSGRVRYPLILDELNSQRSDVVLLQEVTPVFLRLLKLHPLSKSYFLTITHEKMAYQNIILSKQKPLRHEVLALESNLQRKALLVYLEWSDNPPLSLINVHLESSPSDQHIRKRQLEQILKVVEDEPNVIVGGDFNFGSGSEEEKYMSKKMHDLAQGSQYTSIHTYDVDRNTLASDTKYWFESSRRLDRIYQRFSSNIQANYSLIGDSPSPITTQHLSDHFGIRSDIVIQKKVIHTDAKLYKN